MRTIWLATAALAALTVASAAQTVERKNSAAFANAPPIAASSWSGFYLGLGLGFRATRTDAALTSELTGPPLVPFDLSQLATGQAFDGIGFRASPYAGFNWQFAPRWVAGIEGDAGFARQTSTRASFAVPFTLSEADLGANNRFAVRTAWDASLRGRLGFLLTPSTLVYATGGVAWQHYDATASCDCSALLVLSPKIVSNSATKAGWTIGGGLETALWGHWLARAEYRYADFGTSSFAVARAGTEITSAFASVDTVDVSLRTHTATFGLAYKFGDPVASDSITAFASGAAPTGVLWSGLYTGLGLGARVSQSDLTTSSVLFGNTPVDLTGAATTRPYDGTVFRGNSYIGFNWQFMPRWVAGIEGDVGYANGSTTLSGFFTPFLQTLSPADTVSLKTTWDASLRGRIGLLISPATLVYLTSGVAWQHYEVTTTCGGISCAGIFGLTPSVVSSSTTKAGWTLGGGLETALWGPWLARAEYRYADFGSTPMTIARTGTGGTTLDNFDARLRTHTVNFGLAYKFN